MFMYVLRIPARSMDIRVYQISLSNQDGFEVGSEGYNVFVSIFQAVVADDPQLEKDAMFVSTEWRRRPFLAIFFSRTSLASRMRP